MGWHPGLAGEFQATLAGRLLPATPVLPPMARSGNATPLAPAPGTPPRSPSQVLVQVWWWDRVGSEDPGSQPSLCPQSQERGLLGS